MKPFQIKKILIPIDFSNTALLAVEHAASMAQLFKAELYLLHSIEITETSFAIYEPPVLIIDLIEVEKTAEKQLSNLAEQIKKEFGITVNTLCTRGKAASELITAVEDNNIDIVVMGTHGASGFNEYFMGSNAHKVVTICKCPVITVQMQAKKVGFKNIVLPIDDALHSREKVDCAITLAKKYKANIHILGLLDEDSDLKKFKIKLESVEKAIKKAGLAYDCRVTKEKNLAVAAMKYSKKVKGDLIVALSDHESHLTGMFLDAFTKQIVNHSKIPVMSIKPTEGIYEPLSLAAATPY